MAHRQPQQSGNGIRWNRAFRQLAGVLLTLVVSSGSAAAQDMAAWEQEPVPARAATEPVGFPISAAVARLTSSPTPAPAQRRGPGRHPVLLGTLIGAAGGAVWQASRCGGVSCNIGTAGLVGAGVGAYSGLIVSAVQKARAKEPVSRGAKIGLVAGAVAATVGVVLACYGAGGCGGAS
jgi:hypothetical protein